MKAGAIEAGLTLWYNGESWLIKKVERKGSKVVVNVQNGSKHETLKFSPDQEVEVD